MLRDEENHVALFIDWDNLAISTAADLGGASPDVRAIVRVAQRYGTILSARAYAEWQVTSDRMAVYRSGVDPVYAPTFRFEPDPVNQAPRGKSLADPCLVADCIDTLHLLPSVNHFVLVSGDKDLIPIVRLVQLRGKKVVVIGPDYVAAILRDMADEYVSYRSLVESGEAVANPEPAQQPGVRRGRRPSGRVSAPAPAPAPAAPAPAVTSARPVRTPAPPAQPPRHVVTEPATPPPSRPLPFEQPPAVEAEELAPAVEPAANGEVGQLPEAEPREVSPEALKSLMGTIEQILHEREAQGKPRLRATNLKDLLMARISGFNERQYGFSKLRDLLTAAEKAGILEISRSGPVQWVTLPRHREERPAEVETPATPAAPAETPAVEPVVPPAAQPDGEANAEIIRFIAELRGRSRWLTYTYVLTNLITHLAQRLPPQAAEAEARNSLNRLVQADILRIDREPREIEVGGARHRVRLCHLEESHPEVQAVLASETPAEPEGQPAEVSQETAAPAGPEQAPAAEAAPVEVAAATDVPTTEPVEAPAAPRVDQYGLPPLPDALLAPSAGAPIAPVVPPAQPSAPAPVAPAPVEAPAPAPAPEPAAPAEAPSSPSLAEAFAALREVVRQATGPDKPMAGAASVKTRLGRRMGGFDEHSYGFSKFKDFLLAAQREGHVRVESVGPATRVALPQGE